jgi:hypothetical protein
MENAQCQEITTVYDPVGGVGGGEGTLIDLAWSDVLEQISASIALRLAFRTNSHRMVSDRFSPAFESGLYRLILYSGFSVQKFTVDNSKIPLDLGRYCEYTVSTVGRIERVSFMIICFKCSPETKEALDTLVESEQYRDYAEAISIAVVNLAVLQGELADKEAIVIPGVEPQANRVKLSASKSRTLKRNRVRKAHTVVTSPKSRLNALSSREPIVIPQFFLIDSIEQTPPAFASLPNEGTGGPFRSLDFWSIQ